MIHLPALTFAGHVLLLVAGALLCFAGEIIPAPLTFTPTRGERPWRVINDHAHLRRRLVRPRGAAHV
jgi:UDP-N-acetyl-D-mannosaminuronic acid transferase (WecB/TagA/CpsF family)